MKILLSIVGLILCSCQSVTGNGQVTVVWDNEKSFSDGALVVGAVAGGLIQAGVSKAKEVTARASDANRTTEVLGAQGVQKLQTTEETKRILGTTLNPNIIPK